MVFLIEQHPYKISTSPFNGKPKRTQRLAIMTPIKCIKAYERQKDKEIKEIFDSNWEPMFNDL
jgi:hypothetical protein